MRLCLLLPVLLLINLLTIAQTNCQFNEYKQEMLQKDPGLRARVQEIESFTRNHGQNRGTTVTGVDVTSLTISVITIPVVVHVVYNTSAQNISDAQIQSQLVVLNRDYRKLNADTAGIPSYFSSLAADCHFQFALANVDTNGNATTGIIRKHTNVQAFAVNDDMKSASTGGDDAWDRDRYLNIWVVNLTGGVLGYSSIPGGAKETDGVAVLYTAFGTMGTAAAPFNLGRTATHEIGHWLNMIHVWGDANCGTDDVEDTPQQQAATRGNPSGMIVTCGNGPFGNMYMDYMDFTDDIGMHMFTYGQRDRMRSLFGEGGFRYPLLSSNALSGTPPDSSNTTTSTPVAPANGAAIALYPNPASSAVSVNIADGSRIGSMLDVYSQTGQRIMSVRISQSSMLLNVSSLPQGLYFIGIRDQHGMSKLVKL
jgi:hypothetical protein